VIGQQDNRCDAVAAKTVRILIVDDNETVKRSLRALLAMCEDCEICGDAATAGEAIEKARQLQPDVILLDISLPDFTGLEAAPLIHKDVPDCKIIIVSQHSAAQVLAKAFESGASGYVVKDNLGHDLIPAIRSILAGPDFAHQTKT
jgi:DNA-binding NarL/FixJ family response regulator